MGYYNEIFIEEEGKLRHIASCDGSDTPCYFDEVKSLKDWENALQQLKDNQAFWESSDTHPFPWKSYKTSDNLIVLRKIKRYFWFDRYEVWVSAYKYQHTPEDECVFLPIKYFFDSEEDGSDILHAEILKLPKL
jgi:hypothetical protein